MDTRPELNLMLIILYTVKLIINVINVNLDVNYKYFVQVADKLEVTRQSICRKDVFRNLPNCNDGSFDKK